MEFRILRLLEVVEGDDPVELRGAKVRSLLAMLLLHANHVVSADRLAEALWGDDRPESAANTLQGYVSQLRKKLGPATIRTRTPGYMLAVSPEQIDAVRFEQLVAEGRDGMAAGDSAAAAERLKQALGLWRGEPLADFTYEAFAQPHIARLNELRLVAIEELMEAELALGRHAELVGPLRSHVDVHPLRERLWAQLATALYRCGRQAEALRALAEVRERLSEELGIGPSAAIRTLENAVLLQSSELEWHPPISPPGKREDVPHNIPPARSSFVGREREMAELEKLVEAGGLVTVVGPGGVGKSRLARELARDIRGRFPEGVWLVDLATVEDSSLVGNAVASVLGVEDSPRIAEALHRRRVLLLLDNCEHVIEAVAELVGIVLARAIDLTLLATSRQPLRIEGETVWRLSPLPVPVRDAVEPHKVGEYEAVALFVDRAGVGGRFALTNENVGVVADLCRRLDGLPLAIELAASRTRALSPVQLLERLHDRFSLLAGGSRTLARHRTLRASLDWSYSRLSQPERTLFRRLGALDRPFTLEDAEEIAGGDELDRDDVVELLASLVDRSLVLADQSNSEVRYWLPECHRAYAALHMAGDDGQG